MSRLFVAANSDHISDLTASPINTFPITISCWFKPTNFTAGQYLVQLQDQNVPDSRLGIIYRGEIDQSVEAYTQGSSAYRFVRSNPLVADHEWTFCAAIFTSTTLRSIKAEGFLNKAVSSAPGTVNAFDSVTIGRAMDSTPGFSIDGRIAHVAIWNVDCGVVFPDWYHNSLIGKFWPDEFTELLPNLVFYAPLTGAAIEDTTGNASLTASGTTFSADNPTKLSITRATDPINKEDQDPAYYFTSAIGPRVSGARMDGCVSTVVFEDDSTLTATWNTVSGGGAGECFDTAPLGTSPVYMLLSTNTDIYIPGIRNGIEFFNQDRGGLAVKSFSITGFGPSAAADSIWVLPNTDPPIDNIVDDGKIFELWHLHALDSNPVLMNGADIAVTATFSDPVAYRNPTGDPSEGYTGTMFATITVEFNPPFPAPPVEDYYDLPTGKTLIQFTFDASQVVFETQDYIRHCPEHKFVYRPDTRIWPMSETHCPKGNHPLRDWRTRQRGDDDSEVFDAIDIDDGLDF
jgi:hypothetical protein